MSGIWRRFASVACRSGRAASLEASTAVASLSANPSYGSSATRGFTHRGSGSERWLAACATQGLGRGFAARGFRTHVAVASDASDASDASNAASGGNVDYYSVKPTRGKNRWRRARAKAAFIKTQAREHRENKTMRAEEREAKRLQRWRENADAARAWKARKEAEAVERAESALRQFNELDGDETRA